MVAPFARMSYGTRTLYRRDWALLADAGRAAAAPIRVVQGSFHAGVSASAGTHNGGGAIDLSIGNMSTTQALRLVDQLRRRNCAAWLRTPAYGWPKSAGGPHIHCIVMDDPGLSRGARAQVAAYRAGLNGLASKRRDPFHRPPQSPFLMPGQKPVKPVSPGVAVRLRNLVYGARNADVRDLQLALHITVDGWYGPATDRAVRAHQKRMGLRPDPWHKSYVGPRQAKHLGLIPQ